MQRTRIPRLVAVLLAMALVVAACGDDDDGGEAGGTTTTTSGEAPFPVTVTADNGEVLLDAQPQRIVSLSPSLTEMLYAIDAGAQVVAVDKSSNYPEGTPTTDLSGFSPNVEAIGGHTPDLVVLSRDKDGAAAALSGLGIPTLVLSSADTIDDVFEQIDVLGDATGHSAEAFDLVQSMKADIEGIVTEHTVGEPSTYFYELSDEYHSVTSDTFIGELLGIAGFESIADGVDDAADGFPQLTAEHILEQDPDFVFLAHADGAEVDLEAVAARPGWAELQAVQQGRVVVLPADIASRWGPRVVDLLEIVAAAKAAAQSTTTTAAG